MSAKAHHVVAIHFLMKQMKQRIEAFEAGEADEISRRNI